MLPNKLLAKQLVGKTTAIHWPSQLKPNTLLNFPFTITSLATHIMMAWPYLNFTTSATWHKSDSILQYKKKKKAGF